jgi:microcystin-dependent protein
MSRNYSSIVEPKTLAADVLLIATQITLNNVTGLPSAPYVLVLNPDTASEEVILVDADQSGVTSPTLKVTRAIESGATAKTHTNGDTVKHMIVGSDLQLVHNHLDATAAHGATGAVVGTTNTQTLTNKTLTLPKINENVTLTATATELNVLDGITASTAELNIMDGVTSTTAELNILDGVTSSTAELNILDGVTSSAAELNILDGATLSTAELNYVDGVTSAIQTQLNTIVNTTIPNATPTGTVVMWVTDAAPTGWILCQGQEVLVSEYTALDGVLGTTYGARTNGSGAAGTTHFRVPDLRGRVPMGSGTGRNVADSANLSARTLGTKVSDAETHTLTIAEMPSHDHQSLQFGPSGGAAGLRADAVVTTDTRTGFTGGGGAHNNTQPSTVINFIIKS